MNITYKTKKLEKSFTSDWGMIKAYGNRAKKIKQRRNELEESNNLEVITKLKALRLHPLIGKRKDQWSIDIMKNWRILFTINHDPIPVLPDGSINYAAITDIEIYEVKDTH